MNKTAKGNWPLYSAWLVVLVITIAISFVYHQESTSFSGIAETREIVVNSESPVDIRRINVTEGQTVEKGTLLVELSSPELVLKINHLEHQLDELKAQKGVDKTELQSRIRQLQAEKTAKENEITSQITELENEYNINRKLISDLKSVPVGSDGDVSDDNNPIRLKIRNLKKELSLSVNSLVVQIELLQKTLDYSNAPVEIQVERLEKELVLLKKENSQLNIYAQISGVIGSVNFKPGEKASPFAPILTLHAKTPSFIKGYIYENAYAKIKMGDKVDVASCNESGCRIPGQVVGVGARIVEYPVRLRKHPDFQVWGREVVIKIPENNPFILGEKVSITSQRNKGIALRVKNMFSPDESRAESPDQGLGSQKSEFLRIDKKAIEASGIMYLKDLQKYLVISDDTKDDKPLVCLVDSNGKVSDEMLIEGADEIEDMESIAEADNGILYIASSSSANKKGKIKEKRSRLLSVRRDQSSFSLLREVDLYSGLKNCAERNRGKEWADFILSGITEESAKDFIDIEGMFYKNGSLFLGFKAPLAGGQSVILRIADIDAFMHTGALGDDQVSIWKKIILQCEDGSFQERISDLCYIGDTLYITGTSLENDESSRSGSLWRLDEITGTSTRLMIFNSRAPEGISAGEDSDSIVICFDGGSKEKSEITRIPRP
ncbi:HlyD family secretion protein [Desulforegula conservatrix]|uniref:HlyD family secretion protein n=1 Tax=Desulforegula conservatrix TaxID=153026 RepID=UPI00040B0C4A|nr:HlyD family efflux transporter periplasmic adaptor subunit [Desulforegula conservatrix]